MNLSEKVSKLKEEYFKQIIGVKRATFYEMTDVLRQTYASKHQNRVRHSKLSIEEQLFMSLKYWRQYITQKELTFEFCTGEATAHDIIVWVENTLVKSAKFSLPSKKALLDNNEIETVLVDVSESPIERPKKTKVVVFRKAKMPYNKDTTKQ